MTEIEIMLLCLIVTTFAWLMYTMAKLGKLEQEIKDLKMKIFSEKEKMKSENEKWERDIFLDAWINKQIRGKL